MSIEIWPMMTKISLVNLFSGWLIFSFEDSHTGSLYIKMLEYWVALM